jgi:hypothetical protein
MVITYKNLAICCSLLFFGFLASCKKEVTDNYSALPVVEAYLMPGKNVEIKVSLQKGLVDTNAYGVPVTGLQLQISDGTATKTLVEDKAGHYMLNDLSFIKGKGAYNLSFTYNNLAVTASTTIPDKPSKITTSSDTVTIPAMVFGSTPTAFNPVTLSYANSGSYNHVILFKYLESSKVLISNRFNRDTTTNVEVNAVKAASFEITQNMFRYYGNYQVVLLRVNQEYIDMLNSSSTSSQNLTNAPTNVTNGLGIFTGMQADTLTSKLLVKSEL